MKIDVTLLTRLENLSSLKIEESRRESMISEIGKIVDFVENLNELDLDDEEASFSTIEGGTPFREDAPRCDPEIIESILAHAPKAEGGFFVVPKIID